MIKIKDLPEAERPRERLLQQGAASLSNQDLLAILFRTGTKEKNVQTLSSEVLSFLGDIHNIEQITVAQLIKIKGLGPAKAIALLACLELGKRIFLERHSHHIKLTQPQQVYEEMSYLFFGKKQEYFYCLYLNNKQELIERKLLFMGTLNRSIVHPREVFKEAYLSSASSIICVHNHPSNDVRPSKEDVRFTKSLMEIGVMQGIPVTDHIIIGETGYYSFYENHNLFNL